MVEITLVEIHLEDATFDATATAPLANWRGGDGEDETEHGGEREDGQSRNGPPAGKLLAGLLVVVALGVALWWRRRDRSVEPTIGSTE